MRADVSDLARERLTERNDPRFTRVGGFLRRTSLDELPQIINVLRGEMSVIGARAHAIRTTAGGRLCEEVVDRYSVRHKVRPGITGWAQVNGWRGTMGVHASGTGLLIIWGARDLTAIGPQLHLGVMVTKKP